MRTIVVLLVALGIASPAAGSALGDKLAREVCSYNRSYILTPAELAEYGAVDVTGTHQYSSDTERFFLHPLAAGSGGAVCQQRVNGASATCKTSPVIRSGDLLVNSGGWVNASC